MLTSILIEKTQVGHLNKKEDMDEVFKTLFVSIVFHDESNKAFCECRSR